MKRESSNIQRLLALKARSQTRSYVQDDDLQIQVPSSKESSNAENMAAFKNIYSHYMYENSSLAPSDKLRNEARSEMEEASHSFESMMEFRKSITDAYLEFVKK